MPQWAWLLLILYGSGILAALCLCWAMFWEHR